MADSVRWMAEIGEAIEHAGSRGLVHRDIKPSNIMLSSSGAKVLDFGIAAAAGEADSAHADGEIWGTPAYLAPERLEGGSVVPASDVYALGLMLYRLLSGGLPWPVQTTTEMIKAHRYDEPAPLPYLPGVHSAVREICARCLAKDPAERPAAGEVARVLAAAIGRHSRAVATAVGRSRPPGSSDPRVDTGGVAGTKYRNVRPGVPRAANAVGVLAEESGGALAEPVAPEAAARDRATGEAEAAGGEATGEAEAAGGEATGEAEAAGGEATGEAEAAGTTVDPRAADREVPGPGPAEFVEERAAPVASASGRAGSAVAAVRVPSGSRPGRAPRRRAALAGAAVLVAVGVLAGYCATGDRPDGAPRAEPTASAPTSTAVGGSVEQAAPTRSAPSGPVPDSPIQPGAAGANPGTGDGAATGAPGPGAGTRNAGPGDGAGTTPEPGPVERTFDTVGGTVTVRCVGPTATLVGYDPLPGFVPSLIDRGPGPAVGLTLSAVVATVRIGARCDDGVPVASID
jgi:serine/threonine-protein kinase